MSTSTKVKTRKSGYLATKSYTANTLMLVGIGYFMIPIVWVIVNSTKNNTYQPPLKNSFKKIVCDPMPVIGFLSY